MHMGNDKRNYTNGARRTLKVNRNKRQRQTGARLAAEAFAFMAMRPTETQAAPSREVTRARRQMRTIKVADARTPWRTVEHTFQRNVYHAR